MTRASQPNGAAGAGPKRFGAFAGVFTPSLLTILGVIMYLRFGWVVGNLGLTEALFVVAVSHFISVITGLSVSSIATNRTVGAGGAYYMVSRSLGAATGAAIGIPLFFAQALSITFYLVGFTESLSPLVPWLPPVVIATIMNVLLSAISLRSSEAAIKAQYLVMAAIGLSLVSMFAGHAADAPAAIAWGKPAGGAGFAEVFAVFFPAVTGIMAGVSMSGDLRDPRRAIPLGTMAAIITGLLIYVAVPIWLAKNAGPEALRGGDVVWRIAAVPSLVYLGVWGATLSSALSSILAAPRTLQALAVDGLMPAFFARGHGRSNEPRAGIVVSFAIAQAGILLGSLDAIASVLTMFFLATYGFTNLACGLEKWAASPSFRPAFRVPAGVSLLGALGSFYVMSIIDLPSMIVAVVIVGGIYFLVQRRRLKTTYGDARHGIWSAMVRSALQRLRRSEWHARNWRPNLIILGGDPKERPYLVQLGSALVQDSGLVTYFYLIRGSVAEEAERRRALLHDVLGAIGQDHPNVLCRVDIVDDLYRGVVSVAQSYGVGTFEANTVMLGWLREQERADGYAQMLRELPLLGKSMVLVRHRPERGFGARRRIHIWWGGLARNGGLMLLLAVLLCSHPKWRQASVTVITVVEDHESREQAFASLRRILEEARVDAEATVIARAGRTIAEVMKQESAIADLALVGIRLPADGESGQAFVARIDALLDVLPTTMLVHGARDVRGEIVLFDEPKDSGGAAE